MIEAQNLLNIPDIRHGFFNRHGGSSTGIYSSLNCGLGSLDTRENIIANRASIAATLGLPHDRLLNVHQIHSPEIINVTAPWNIENAPKADGMVTKTPGIGLSILTADCAPILYADPNAHVIGASHAGWQGAIGGISDNIIVAMEDLGAQRSDIVAVIGPTISSKAYEVGPEFADKFLAQDKEHEKFFTPSDRTSHFMFDLPAYLVQRLKRAEIGSVINTNICTYDDENGFFSYRRATHRSEKDYGRQLSAITLV